MRKFNEIHGQAFLLTRHFLLDFWWYNPPGNKTFSIHGILQLLSLKFEAISALMMENLVLATCGAVVVVSHCWNHGLVSWSPKRFGVRRSYGIREDLLRFECFKNKEFPQFPISLRCCKWNLTFATCGWQVFAQGWGVLPLCFFHDCMILRVPTFVPIWMGWLLNVVKIMFVLTYHFYFYFQRHITICKYLRWYVFVPKRWSDSQPRCLMVWQRELRQLLHKIAMLDHGGSQSKFI